MYGCYGAVGYDGVVIQWPQMAGVSAKDARHPIGASGKEYD